jgi:hypothetical protein
MMALALAAPAAASACKRPDCCHRVARPPCIQLAILLDTSNSMDGLIDQARSQLWAIVNEFATTRKHGRIPELQMALFEYGNTSLPVREGYLRQVVGFTSDLDLISEKLFALTTHGGDEYCGQVIQEALRRLDWSERPEDFRVIFIAGNEPFTQGPVDYQRACRAAIDRGVVVNTIHCGTHEEGVRGKWQHGARLAEGEYLTINMDRKAVYICAPQDVEIIRLGEEFNRTYIPFGDQADVYSFRQEAQDRNALAAAPAAPIQRAVAKSSANYRNSSWDLADAVKENTLKLEDVAEKDLPDEMQRMSPAERQQYVRERLAQRQRLQKQIGELNRQREAFVAAELKKRADAGQDDTLEAVVITTVRQQLLTRKFTRETASPSPADPNQP